MGFTLSTCVALAQYPSRLGTFTVDQIRFCAGYTITITPTIVGRCTNTFGNTCIMDFENGKPCPSVPNCQNVLTYTYNSPGTYKLIINYQSVSPDDIMVTVDPSTPPTFEVSICGANKAFVKITDTTYPEYAIDFGDGAGFSSPSPTKTFTHTYLPGSQSIGLRGIFKNNDGSYAASNCSVSTQSFTVLPTLPSPSINTLTANDATQLTLDFLPQPNVQSRIDISVDNTNFQPYKNSVGTNTETISGLKVDDKYYCFRLSAFDPCTNAPDNLTIVGPICSHNFDLRAKDGTPTARNGIMQLDWQTSTASIVNTNVLRRIDGSSIFSSVAGGLPGSFLMYEDRDPSSVNCNTKYIYKLESEYDWGGGKTGRSISLEKSGTSFTTIMPPVIINTSAAVSTSGVQLDWIQTPPYTTTSYNLFRSKNQGTFFSLTSAPLLQYQDNTYNSESQFCYLINYADQCSNTSGDSSPICPIRLLGTVGTNNKISLSWNEYTGWNLGVKYYLLEKFDKNGGLISSIPLGTDTAYPDDVPDNQNQVVSYRVTAFSNESGLKNSVSNQIILTKEINLFYPTAFTPDNKPLPNGSIENETFTVRGQFIAKTELSIFDRWGSLIFYSDKNESWDGRQNGQPMPIASYVWTANITDLAGRTFQRSGTVLLLRK
jgi:gliding motility-associated-like protein